MLKPLKRLGASHPIVIIMAVVWANSALALAGWLQAYDYSTPWWVIALAAMTPSYWLSRAIRYVFYRRPGPVSAKKP